MDERTYIKCFVPTDLADFQINIKSMKFAEEILSFLSCAGNI